MKCIIFLLCLFLISCENKKLQIHDAYAKRPFKRVAPIKTVVDSIDSNEKAINYAATVDTNMAGFNLRPFKELGYFHSKERDSFFKATVLKYKADRNFYKADFDNNGYTDLLLIGGWRGSSTAVEGSIYFLSSYVFMNYGTHPAKYFDIINEDAAALPLVKHTVDGDIIEIHDCIRNYRSSKKERLKDSITTLKWVELGFAEIKPDVKNYQIEKIQFTRSPCFGKCPIFEITIYKDRSAIILADRYNSSSSQVNPDKTAYKCNIEKKDYNQLINFLNYADFPSLKNHYSVMWTDSATAELIITYNNGKVKKISDYGLMGTYALKSLYSFLSEWRFNQSWNQIDEPKGVRINRLY